LTVNRPIDGSACFLDWAEVRLRRFARFVKHVWRSSVLGKVAAAYVAYRLFFGG
jgi:hypothetical protein